MALSGPLTEIFLSTPSARRATHDTALDAPAGAISIHALREEGDRFTPAAAEARRNFYPRPPRGGRPVISSYALAAFEFLSTPSARRATPATWLNGREWEFLSTPSARRATCVMTPNF